MFKLHSPYKPTGDQPQAIEYLSKGIDQGKKFQTLLGVTGSGKTFTMANIINKVQKPTLVLAHNKTLAGQLYSEFKEFFPENNVEYFVSYYDYYQPESYIASSDTYIEKDASINDEIDKLRHSATLSLFETRDVIIVASVSCIYGLGDPVDYQEMMLSLRPGMNKSRDEVLKKLVIMQYTRNEIDFKRGTFRAKGDIVEIYPSSQSESAVRVEFWGDEIEKISEINPLTGKAIGERKHILIPPASQYVTSKDKLDKAIGTIEEELHRSSKNLNVEIETHLYTDGNDMLGLMKNNKDYFDVVFLDIDMPKISGLDVAAKMRSINQEILLVFISAHEQYVFDSIDYSPIKYIRKLKMHDEIELALKKANKCINSRNTKTIIIKTDDGEIRLRHDDIMYFEMYRRRITVYINNGKAIELKERKTIKSLYEELDDEDFVQIHSGGIVNVKYIYEYSGYSITLDNETKLVISRSRLKEVKAQMARYWRNRV